MAVDHDGPQNTIQPNQSHWCLFRGVTYNTITTVSCQPNCMIIVMILTLSSWTFLSCTVTNPLLRPLVFIWRLIRYSIYCSCLQNCLDRSRVSTTKFIHQSLRRSCFVRIFIPGLLCPGRETPIYRKISVRRPELRHRSSVMLYKHLRRSIEAIFI